MRLTELKQLFILCGSPFLNFFCRTLTGSQPTILHLEETSGDCRTNMSAYRSLLVIFKSFQVLETAGNK